MPGPLVFVLTLLGVFEGFLFSLFTCIMFCTQIHAICTDETVGFVFPSFSSSLPFLLSTLLFSIYPFTFYFTLFYIPLYFLLYSFLYTPLLSTLLFSTPFSYVLSTLLFSFSTSILCVMVCCAPPPPPPPPITGYRVTEKGE